jgi:uncharacterized protein YutE (UPF0331/DUF86 family)
MESIIVACITGALSLIGVIISNVASYNRTMAAMEKAQAVTDERIEQLTRVVRVHNSIVERTYALESSTKLLDEKIKVANHRIDDLERGAS